MIFERRQTDRGLNSGGLAHFVPTSIKLHIGVFYLSRVVTVKFLSLPRSDSRDLSRLHLRVVVTGNWPSLPLVLPNACIEVAEILPALLQGVYLLECKV